MNITKKVSLSSVIALSLFSSTVFAQQVEKELYLTVLHTNDTHGSFWADNKGQGGMAARKTIIDQVRQEVEAKGGKLLVLDAGDINTGTPASNILDAQPDLVGLKLLGYDAITVGNHEFDKPLETIKKQQTDWSEVPYISANIYDKKTNERVFAPYKTITLNGKKITIFGLTTPRTLSTKFLRDTYNFTDALEQAKETIAEIKQQEQPDLIFALTHIGYYENGNHGTEAPGDFNLANGLPKGDVAAIFGGHSHTLVCMQEGDEGKLVTDYKPGDECRPDNQNGTWIFQAGEKGHYIGRADFSLKNGAELKLENYQIIPINVQGYNVRVEPNKDVEATLKAFRDQSEAMLSEKIAETHVKLVGERDIVRSQPTNLGALVADSMLYKTGADISFVNSGGIRASIQPGDITVRDVLTVTPFRNTIVIVDLSADELLEYLKVAAGKSKGAGGYPQYSSNLKVESQDGKLISVEIDGKPIDMTRRYKFAIPSFIADGVDRYPVMNDKASFHDTGIIDHVLFIDYLKAHSPISQ